jgi:phospholipid/cholesterol/gamma-HCH transport system substrate-binding protein
MGRTRRLRGIGTGAFALVGFLVFGYLIDQIPGNIVQVGGEGKAYQVMASFTDVGYLKAGAPVVVAGVTIGRVSDVGLNPHDYRALVTMQIYARYQGIPDDSTASVNTADLLGGQFIRLDPGGSDHFLHGGSEIKSTQSALVLENLINRFVATTTGAGAPPRSR